MKQSRKASATESILNILIGFSVQFAASAVVLNGVLSIPISFKQNFILGIIMTVVSFIRSYTLRRLFEHLRVKGIMP